MLIFAGCFQVLPFGYSYTLIEVARTARPHVVSVLKLHIVHKGISFILICLSTQTRVHLATEVLSMTIC